MTRQASCIMPWRAVGAAGVEVLLVERAAHMATLGGFWAFAGGAQDAMDRQAMPDHEMRQSQHCGLRELFEETGILPPVSLGQHLSHARREQVRAELLATGETPPGCLAPLGLNAWLLAYGETSLQPLGRWETPPFGSGRFAARYFALELSPSLPRPEPEIWPGELTAARWSSPEQALADHESAKHFLAQPVRHTLKTLASARGTGQQRVAEAAALLEQEQPAKRLALDFADGITLVPLRTKTLAPHTHTNCYVLGHRRLAIVDPGAEQEEEQDKLMAYLEGRKARGAQVEAIWLTHAHHDHIGAASRIQRAFGARVMAHRDAAAHLPAALVVDKTLEDNQQLSLGSQSWQALHTPGHAPGHLCFLAAETKHLIAGDHVLGFGTSLISPAPQGSMCDYFTSLKRIAALELGLMLPAHGPPSATANKRIGDTLSQRQARERLILATVDEFAAQGQSITIDSLVARVYRGLGASLRGLAELSTRAHVEKLIADRKLLACTAETQGGTVHYARLR